MTSLALVAGAALSGPLLPASSAKEPSAAMVSALNLARTAAAAGAGDSAALPTAPSPLIAQALDSGVLIVVSKASQRMHVFSEGRPWLSSPVSTGRRGHSTPAGVFPIMEKRRFHRSNLYSNAPMPFMQRLTRGGIAIHAGHVPGHPASHGCIRVPYSFARALFGLTRPRETIVVVVNAAMQNDEQARRLALAVQPPRTGPALPITPGPVILAPVILAYAPVQLPDDTSLAAPTRRLAESPARPGVRQTIQLAATTSPQEAEARWGWLIRQDSDLGRFDKSVMPVVVGPQRYFRLRASGPGAFAYCSHLKSAGLDCFPVR